MILLATHWKLELGDPGHPKGKGLEFSPANAIKFAEVITRFYLESQDILTRKLEIIIIIFIG